MTKVLNDSRIRVFALVLAVIMALGALPIPAHAAGVETLHYGENYIGQLTVTDQNTTPEKTIPGGYIRIRFKFKRADIDQGVGNIKITIRILDEDYNQLVSGQAVTDPAGYSFVDYESGYISLGSTGQKIHIWFDVSSAGQSNGYYRSARIENFYIDVL